MLKKPSILCKLIKSNNYRLRALEIITSSHTSIIFFITTKQEFHNYTKKWLNFEDQSRKTWYCNKGQRSQSKQIKIQCTNSSETPQKILKPDEQTRILFTNLLNLSSGYHHNHGRLSHKISIEKQENMRTKNNEYQSREREKYILKKKLLY